MSDNNSNNNDKNNIKDHSSNLQTIVEGSAQMCYPADQEQAVFYNPVQVQNRDLSILIISLFATQRVRQQQKQATKPQQAQKTDSVDDKATKQATPTEQQQQHEDNTADNNNKNKKQCNGITILEALAASGLRSIRYWNEIPHVHHITINDLELAAVERAHTNIQINNLQHVLVKKSSGVEFVPMSSSSSSSEEESSGLYLQQRPAGIRIHHGDATNEMYTSRRLQQTRFTQQQLSSSASSTDIITDDFLCQRPQWDVIDLDPYGSSCTFLDAAVQAVADDGLLCITCTDMAALGGSHPETCFGRYAVMPMRRAGYLQELALRALLYATAMAAARYGRTIRPVLAVGMDFYVRVFCRVRDDKAGVNALSLRIGSVYQSTQCPSFYVVPAGQMGGRKGNVYQAGRAPAEMKCEETGAELKIAGPVWLGPLHDKELIKEALAKLEGKDDTKPNVKLMATRERLRGLLMSCLEELDDAPLFYKLSDVAKAVQCPVPPLREFKAGLVNAGYRVSGYHKDPVAIKTDAPNHAVWDVMRAWYRKNKPKKDPAPGSAAEKILSKEPSIQVDFSIPASLLKSTSKPVARFPKNPRANWGPKAKASGRKRAADTSPERER